MMVEPEREVPGTMESTWKRPMPRAVFQSRSSMFWMRASASATCEIVSSCCGCDAPLSEPEKWRGRYAPVALVALAATVEPAAGAAIRRCARRSRTVSITMKAMP